jgi:hypothetical protein
VLKIKIELLENTQTIKRFQILPDYSCVVKRKSKPLFHSQLKISVTIRENFYFKHGIFGILGILEKRFFKINIGKELLPIGIKKRLFRTFHVQKIKNSAKILGNFNCGYLKIVSAVKK